ncbi:MAG: DUF2029 domain-containing protein [Chloroflexi bacterium]|nr:MAG: DUF2029 domain-containing protein [Chloroflexota bacterium]
METLSQVKPVLQNRTQTLRLIFGLLLTLVGIVILVRMIAIAVIFQEDYKTYYNAASNLLAGESVYASENYQTPFTAIFFVPLALLPAGLSSLVWAIISIFIYFWMIILVLRELDIQLTLDGKVLLTGLALCWYPFFNHIFYGQLSIVIAGCVIGGWALLRRGKQLPAGLLIGLGAVLKLYPALLILYIILRRQWKAALGFVLAGVMGMIISVIILGPQDVIFYFSDAMVNRILNYTAPNNVSIFGAFSRLFTGSRWIDPLVNAPWLYTLLTGLTVLAIIILLCRITLKHREDAHSADLAYAFTIVSMLLISPFTWQHAFPLLVLPFAVIVLSIAERSTPLLRQLTLIAVFLVSFPDRALYNLIMKPEQIQAVPWYEALLLLAPTIGLFILGWLLGDFQKNHLAKEVKP